MIICEHSTAVVILTYNSRKWHELFLPLIVEQSVKESYDVVVIDHASPDDTVSYITHNFPSIHIIRLQENHGFAWGYHEGLKQIHAKYYVLLSADFEVTPNWLAPLQNAMESNYRLAACQPKIRFYKDKEYFEYAGAAGGFMDKWGYLFCRGRIFGDLEKDNHQYDTDIEVFWAGGGCLMVRSDLYHWIGGLDQDLFAHMEEVDLCWRLKNASYKIGVVTESTVFHVGGSIISYGSPQKTFYNFRNNLILLLKNDFTGRLWWLLPLRLLLDGLAGIRLLLNGEVKNIIAVIKAHWSFFVTFGKWHKKRIANKKYLNNPNNNGIYPNSIIQDYFFKHKKTFAELDFPLEPLTIPKLINK